MIAGEDNLVSSTRQNSTLVFRVFAVASAGLAFALAILGSWVRINGAGMTCPDWPLCRGALVPQLVGGVVLEWSHRAVALCVGFFILGAFISGWRLRRSIAGVQGALVALVAIFVAQVAVGGWTIKVANSPQSVAVHWATAMALLAALTVLSLLALLEPPYRVGGAVRRPSLAVALLALAAGCGFVTMCIGSFVSSSQFGLACSTVPACEGTLLGHTAGQFAQMLHRIAALAFFIVGAGATWTAAATGMRRAGTVAICALGLVVLQIALGIGNVVLRMPTLLREAHAANAVVSFLAYVVAAFFAAVDPAARISGSPVAVRSASTVMASSK
jgi:heme A synthase